MIKHQKFALPLFCLLALSSLMSCRKDPEEIAELISDSEAAEIVESAVSSRSAGMTTPSEDAAKTLDANLYNCGIPGDTSVANSGGNNIAGYQYSAQVSWLVNCSNLGLPQSADFQLQGNSAFNAANWNGTETFNGSLHFSGLSLQETAYSAEGQFNFTGNLTGKRRNVDPNLNSTLTVDLSTLTIDKSTKQISSGNGTLQLVVSSASGQSKTLTGTIVFNGNQSATVTINGHSFNINC